MIEMAKRMSEQIKQIKEGEQEVIRESRKIELMRIQITGFHHPQ